MQEDGIRLVCTDAEVRHRYYNDVPNLPFQCDDSESGKDDESEKKETSGL